MKLTKALIPIFVLLFVSITAQAQSLSLKGKVFDSKTKAPLYYTVVNLKGTHVYDLTKEDGSFSLNEIKKGKYTMFISVLGYQAQEKEIDVQTSQNDIKIYLNPSSLDLEEVTVTAQASQSKSGSTTYKIGSQAIQQVQPISVSDILQLIPGNQVGATNLAQVSQVNLRSAGGNNDINSFGTAVIIDGNQLSNDGNMQAFNTAIGDAGGNNVANQGVDLRDIPASNIESVEVVSGVASAKFGNITSGAVIIKRKAGYTPWRVSFNSNPTSYQGGINKGFRLNKGGFLNADFDYTYANNSATSRRNFYQRINTGLRWTKEFSKKLSWSNNLAFSYSLSFDGQRKDPDEKVVISDTEYKNQSYRLSNNGSLNIFGRTNYSLSINYTDQYSRKDILSAGPIPIIESLEEGTYFTKYTPISFHQNTELYGAPLNINGRFDTEQIFTTGKLKHNTNIGIEYSFNKNYGKGKVLDKDGQTASISGPGSRETDFYNVPASLIYSAYFQDDINYSRAKSNYLLKLGARYDYMIEKYHLLSPRLSLSAKYFDKFRIRAAYGLSYKAPSMLQLNPAPAYFDILNLNHYANDEARRLAVVTTYIHQPENGYLKPSKGETFEGGIDFEHKEWNFRLTLFQKKITNGITSNSILKTFEKEIWEVLEEYPDKQPLVGPTGNSIYVSSKMNTYANASKSKTTGIELSAQFPKIKATNTRFNLSGSYLKTNSHRDVPSVKSSGSLTGSQTNRYGVYETPAYNAYICRSNLTVIQHIPEIKLMVTLTGEANWKNKYEVSKYPSIYPIAYYEKTGEYVEIPENMRSSDEFSDLFNSDNRYKNTPIPTYFNFHLQIRKETKQGHSFSFYANNFMWYNPSYIDENNKTRVYQNSKVTFGFGMNFKL